MFITEMEFLKARLAAGKRLNDSHILKEILLEDSSSERKRKMEEVLSTSIKSLNFIIKELL